MLIVNTRLGVKVTEETKEKMSKAFSGRKFTKEQLENRRKNARRGYVVSEETKHKISLKNKGRIRSEETKKKISESLKGRVPTEETKQKIANYFRENSSWNKGMKMSAEIRKNMSKGQTGRVLSQEQKLKISAAGKLFYKNASPEEKEKRKYISSLSSKSSKTIVNTENGIFYDTIKDAHSSYGTKMTLASFTRRLRRSVKDTVPFIYAN